jgi:hypothetical protein
VLKVRAFNDSGDCMTRVVLSAKGQIPPSGLRYTSIPGASEHANPPHILSALPEGITLNQQRGEIHGTACVATARQDYVLTLENTGGKSECTLSLEVGQIAPSGPLTYTTILSSEYADPPQSTGLLIVGDITSMTPTYVNLGVPAGNFIIRPDLPEGITLNAQTGEIQGTCSKPTQRKSYVVTLENPKGKIECKE